MLESNKSSSWDNSLKNIKSNNLYKESINTDCTGVEIDGFLFIPDEISKDTPNSKREYKRTSIMSGGEFLSRGNYIPKEFSFNSTFEVSPLEPYIYDTVFYYMENKRGGCEVISPYLGNFRAEINITVTHPESSPHIIDVEVKGKEIPNPDEVIYGDGTIEYPRLDVLSENVVTIKNKSGTEKDTDELKQQLKIKNWDNPYTDSDDPYINGF